MSLVALCPHCSAPLLDAGDGPACPTHGPGPVLWRPDEPSYDDLASLLELTGSLPSLLPWPLPPGWRVTDLAVVEQEPGLPLGSLVCASGTTTLDGPVDVFTVSEEPGTGLGARVAGIRGPDPGAEVTQGPPAATRVRLGSRPVPLWVVPTSRSDPEFDRSVLVGQHDGRWLWIVVRPAPAVLLLGSEWVLRDACELGPLLVELPVEGPPPHW